MATARRWQFVILAALAVIAVLGTAFVLSRPTSSWSTAPTTAQPVRPMRQVAVIGDSFSTGGVTGGDGAANWVAVVGRQLANEVPIIARNESADAAGYVARDMSEIATGRNFADMVPAAVTAQTALVVIFGGRNDSGLPGVDAATAATFAAVRKAAPNATLLVVGPASTSDVVPLATTTTRNTVKLAADQARARFVDPLAEGWFFGPDASMIGPDGVHPTDAGHAYLAAKMLPHIRASLT